MIKNAGNSVPYNLERVFQTKLGGFLIQYVSKPGLPTWNQISPSLELITDNVTVTSKSRLLYFNCGHGAGVVSLARQARHKEFWLYETNYLALEMTKKTLEINQVGDVFISDEIELLEDQKQTFDDIIIDLPKGRSLAQSWLLKAYDALRVGGRLYLAGSKSEGIQAVIKDAEELLGIPAILGYKKGNRIVRYVKNIPAHKLPVWAQRPGIAPNTWHEMGITIKNHSLKLYSLPGIFSYDRLDPGTQILLSAVDIQIGAQFLDLGCGYGIIGLIAGLSGAAPVDLVDVNLLAVAATRKNIISNGIKSAAVLPSDVLQSVSDHQFDQILTNPPFHSGKAVDYQMSHAFIEQSWRHLKPGGEFNLVANQFIRYDNLMKPLFRQITVLAESNGYRVWQGIKST
jgi:16S rRNA (guanine1207-N2)-methyltransferase